VYLIPALNSNGLLTPLLDAAEINVVATAILLSTIGSVALISALLRPVARYLDNRATKNAKDTSSIKQEDITNNTASKKAAQVKTSLPFKRVRPHQNKEHKKTK